MNQTLVSPQSVDLPIICVNSNFYLGTSNFTHQEIIPCLFKKKCCEKFKKKGKKRCKSCPMR